MTIDDHIGRRRRIYLYSQISYRGTRVPPLPLINETSTQKARNSPLLRHLLQTFPVSLSRRLQAAAPAQYRRSGLTCIFFFFHLRDSCRVKAAQVIIFIHTTECLWRQLRVYRVENNMYVQISSLPDWLRIERYRSDDLTETLLRMMRHGRREGNISSW